jgi:uncharacterized membrane protein YGL010W
MVAMAAGAVFVVSDILRIYLDLDYRIGRAAAGCAASKHGSKLLDMLGGRTWDSWIAEYSESHQHPLNRLTHTFGIPIIMLSLPLLIAGIVWHWMLWVGIALFLGGWTLQFIGHAIEGKPPEFLKDWRFLLVGSRWWLAKMRGKA